MTSTGPTKKAPITDQATGTKPAAKAEQRSPGRTREVFGKAWSNPTGKIGFVILGILVIAAVFAPVLASQDPALQTLSDANTKPFWLGGDGGYLFGTDSLGRDVYSRVLYGLRLSLAVGIITATISAALGLILGILAGYYERFLGSFLLRIADIQFAIPFIAVGIALTAVLGPGIVNLVAVLAVWAWTLYARTIVNSVSQVRRLDFVTAARTLGASTPRIMLRHIAPSVVGPIVVLWSTSVGVTVLAESGLSLLGLGVQAPDFSLGSMLADGQTALRLSWWSVAFPGLALLLIVLAFNMIGDALRDGFNPSAAAKPHNPELT
ncbi:MULTISPECIES: ABC transporter permease [Rhodococcus]|jgi:ABC-type dipeptide/oligopeptide/nickel transport system permease subunit|uniref:ABC transporter permease n=1 Tax=Rhodococcus globerulus TaxID=33008 RepID=A0ABU4BR36_RHOGO|nr:MULTISPECIES: ABC transporter permease [Rhodococcus]MCE4265432.1 ABC transporter permease [Rhodococcus globerulus]MDV6266699.1 ABC transporter permease [Rhodococcus globerulus]MDV8069123.1 ABC transporter permease [Rhodococcus sp. IEGM 1366]